MRTKGLIGSGANVSLVTAEAGEGRGVLGVNRSSSLATAATAEVTTGTTLTTATATATTLATAAAASTTGTLRLDIARVEVNGLLDLALTLTGLLAASGSEVILLVILEGLGVLPLLVEFATLVSRAEVEVTEGKLLLGLLGKVVDVGDALVLGLSGGLVAGSILDESLVLISVGDNLGSLLVLQLCLTLLGTPRGISLLVGDTIGLLAYKEARSRSEITYPGGALRDWRSSRSRGRPEPRPAEVSRRYQYMAARWTERGRHDGIQGNLPPRTRALEPPRAPRLAACSSVPRARLRSLPAPRSRKAVGLESA